MNSLLKVKGNKRVSSDGLVCDWQWLSQLFHVQNTQSQWERELDPIAVSTIGRDLPISLQVLTFNKTLREDSVVGP